MILQKIEFAIKVEWLDPENVDKQKRRDDIKDRLLKLFSHEFGEATVDKHGVKIEVVAVNGVRIVKDREIRESPEVSSSDKEQGVGQSGQ